MRLGRRGIWMAGLLPLLAGAFVWAKLSFPLSYREAQLRPEAVEHVIGLQACTRLGAGDCAARYLYYRTDYQDFNPRSLRIRTRELGHGRARVILHNPRVLDDSTFEEIHRIECERRPDEVWIPVRHEWSHKGRGRLGWTTRPTH